MRSDSLIRLPLSSPYTLSDNENILRQDKCRAIGSVLPASKEAKDNQIAVLMAKLRAELLRGTP